VQLLAEQPRGNARAQIDARARDAAGVRRDRRARVETHDLVALEEPEEHLLAARRQLADLGEQHSSLSGLLEEAGLARGTAVAVHADELGLDERRGQVRAIEDDERMRRAMGEVVDGARRELPSAAGLSGNQDRGVTGGEAAQLREQAAEDRITRDRFFEPALGPAAFPG
jgi:hypothetical protein